MVVFSGCGEDMPKEEELAVESCELDFNAYAGTGTITLRSTGKGDIIASADRPWCHVTVSDKTVNVEVDANGDVNVRSSMITINKGNSRVRVPVTQQGTLFIVPSETIYVYWNAKSYEMEFQSNLPVLVKTDADWLTVEVEGNRIVFKLLNENGKERRTAMVNVSSGNITHQIEFIQKAGTLAYEELLGTWTLDCTSDFKSMKSYRTTLTFTEGEPESNIFLVRGLFDLNPSFPIAMEYDTLTGNLTIHGNRLMGIYSEELYENLYMVLYLGNPNIVSALSTPTYVGIWNDDPDHIVYTFTDGGTFEEYEINSVIIYMHFYSTGSAYGVYNGFTNWTLTKDDSSSALPEGERLSGRINRIFPLSYDTKMLQH
jgi:hypothetical protein